MKIIDRLRIRSETGPWRAGLFLILCLLALSAAARLLAVPAPSQAQLVPQSSVVTPTATLLAMTPTLHYSPAAIDDGVIIEGAVRMPGCACELPSVQILFAMDGYTSHGGVTNVMAHTDEQGQYEFGVWLPATPRKVQVWAELEGYAFDPEVYTWMPERGEIKVINFLARRLGATPTPPPQPGLIVRGSVSLASPDDPATGPGLEGVIIYFASAGHPSEIVAATDNLGQYATDFVPVPGDEEIRMWPELDGYRFDPAYYKVMNSIPFEVRKMNFLAVPSGPVIEGHAWSGGEGNTGLAGVKIFRWTGPYVYDYRVIALTDDRGYFRADLEMVGEAERVLVFAMMEGAQLEPKYYEFTAATPASERTYDFFIPTATPVPDGPGVIVRGRVLDSYPSRRLPANGVEGVRIMLAKGNTALAGQGEVIAVSDPWGQYVSKFIPVEVGVPLRVWAEYEGYLTSPPDFSWTPAAGFEERTVDFVASQDIGPISSPGPTSGP